MPRPAVIGPLIAAQRGHLFVWVPVCLGVGIGLFFASRVEPDLSAYGAAMAAILVLLALSRFCGETFAPLCTALVLGLAGFVLAGARSHLVAAPVLEFRYYGAIEGRVTAIDRSQSGNLRLTLDQVVLERTAPARTPRQVRVSLHGVQDHLVPEPGMLVILTGHLAPPSGPSEPGGFDFQRMAWFQRIGGVGYARTPVLALAPPTPGAPLIALNRLRMAMSMQIQSELPGQVGAFASALVTGDLSGLSPKTVQDMRNSNLSHLLSISGLHMGLLCGLVFGCMRFGLALIPPLALRIPVKKWAAVLAFVTSAAYLALSGNSVATQRSFLMVAVMLCAVLLDRRALTLRSVTIAAILVLLLRPESLLDPGAQMSFAATLALVWVFGEMRRFGVYRLPKWAREALVMVLSSAVAGLATAPIAAAHFNQSASYGLIANLVSVPVMGAIVMPAAVLAACLSLVHLAWIGLWIMGLGVRWILTVSEVISNLDGAVRHVSQPAPIVLPMLVLGMLWVILWQGRARHAGLVPAILAFWIWVSGGRPEVLIAQSGGLIGVMTDAGRALNKVRGDGFAADSWLTRDGEVVDRDLAFARAVTLQADNIVTARIGTLRVALMPTPALKRVADPCAGTDLLIVSQPAPEPVGCLVLDPPFLEQTGGIALWRQGAGAEARTVRQTSGYRVWNSPGLRAGNRAQLARELQHAAVTLSRLTAQLARGPGEDVPERLAADQ